MYAITLYIIQVNKNIKNDNNNNNNIYKRETKNIFLPINVNIGFRS